MKSPTETIAGNLRATKLRIADACGRVGRSPEEITLVAVTKTHPPELVQAAIAAGLTDLGENRVQELVAKTNTFPGEVQGGVVRWHQIGPVQRNKAKEVALRADFVHTLDSLRLAETLDRHAEQLGRIVPCMVQVNVSGEGTKSGIPPDKLPQLLEGLAAFQNLAIRGLMTLASLAMSESELETVVRPEFRLLQNLAETNATKMSIPDGNPALSMGMSGDFEVAIEEGATHIRLGSILFGSRAH